MKVELLDHMGSDLSVVNAARVSFSKESDWVYEQYTSEPDDYGLVYKLTAAPKLSVQDAKLINYLAKHNHWTPFGHCFASFRIKAPIFVARQLGKHQVGLVWNEVSRRYVDDEPEFYVPDAWRKRAENVKQGSSEEAVDFGPYNDPTKGIFVEDSVIEVGGGRLTFNQIALAVYNSLLDYGVCPEQARMVLPQSMMTEWIWSGSIAAFARVCKLRLDPHTQLETQHIAAYIDAEIGALFPVSWRALMNDNTAS